jgi:hypothetical protein
MENQIDLVRYGVLWNKVENYEQKFESIDKKMDKIEAQLEQLVANTNKQAGAAWLGIAMMNALSIIGGWALHYFTSK